MVYIITDIGKKYLSSPSEQRALTLQFLIHFKHILPRQRRWINNFPVYLFAGLIDPAIQAVIPQRFLNAPIGEAWITPLQLSNLTALLPDRIEPTR